MVKKSDFQKLVNSYSELIKALRAGGIFSRDLPYDFFFTRNFVDVLSLPDKMKVVIARVESLENLNKVQWKWNSGEPAHYEHIKIGRTRNEKQKTNKKTRKI